MKPCETTLLSILFSMFIIVEILPYPIDIILLESRLPIHHHHDNPNNVSQPTILPITSQTVLPTPPHVSSPHTLHRYPNLEHPPNLLRQVHS